MDFFNARHHIFKSTDMKIIAKEIKINKPCAQNWEMMEDRNSTRFCENCQKSVIDFSDYTNHEIINFIESSKGSVCGRLKANKINQLTYFTVAPSNQNWLKYIGVLAIGFSLLVNDVKAVDSKNPVELIKSPARKTVESSKTTLPKKIYGYVFDENKKPISGIRVLISNTKLSAITDKNGKYEFVLAEKFDVKNNVIKVNSLRFEGSLKANYASAKQSNLYLNFVEMIMGKIDISRKN